LVNPLHQVLPLQCHVHNQLHQMLLLLCKQLLVMLVHQCVGLLRQTMVVL
jgi:hypothetical protein